MIGDKITLFLLYTNTALLAYLAWNKGACSTCHKIPFLPVPDMFIALTGVTVSIILALLVRFSATRKKLKFLALVISGTSSAIGTFLLASQIFLERGICILCLVAVTIFCIIFYVIGHQTLIASLLKDSKEANIIKSNSGISTTK